MIVDLYQIVFYVKVLVKLVVEVGIGIVVSGVVKVNVDVIQVFGFDGGMGVSFISLIKYVGGLWEFGLVEIYQVCKYDDICDDKFV